MLQLGNYNVKVFHNKDKRVSAVEIYKRNSRELVSTGIAKCHSKDHFCRKTGTKLAISRALERDGGKNISRQDRTAIWDSYRNMTPSPRW